MDVAGLVKLDPAAKRLGCQVETLRIRVRDGRLPVVRGAHGPSLVASGFRPLLAVGDSNRPAFVRRSLDSAERRHLRAEGLAEAEIDAIVAIGMSTDELYELVLRGIDHGRQGTDGRQ